MPSYSLSLMLLHGSSERDLPDLGGGHSASLCNAESGSSRESDVIHMSASRQPCFLIFSEHTVAETNILFWHCPKLFLTKADKG